MRISKRFALAVALGVAGLAVIVTAGSLNPPAAPSSTMKTLDQLEARTPIPCSVYGNGAYVITEPGSYYLTGNRRLFYNERGITVQSDNVTIDLNGFSLQADASSSQGSGIYIDGADNVEIRNGTIRDFPDSGIYSNGNHIRISQVRVLNNGSSGIYLAGDGAHIRGCTASGNGTTGIYAWNNSIVSGNTSSNNGFYGIFARYGSVVSENSCYENGFSGIFTYQSLVNGNAGYGNAFGTCNNDPDSTYVNNTP